MVVNAEHQNPVTLFTCLVTHISMQYNQPITAGGQFCVSKLFMKFTSWLTFVITLLLPPPPAALDHCTVRPNTGLFRTVEPNSPRTVYGLPLYRFDLCYIVYMVRNTIFHHDKVLPLGLLRAYGLPDAP